MILFRFLDLPTLLVASVIVDTEPFTVLLLGLNYPLHGFLHSLLGGSTLAVLTSIIMYKLKDALQNLTAVLKLAQDSSFRKILWTSFLGVYSHILLDSPLYSDIRPFCPIESNPLYGLISSQQIYLFCSISFLVGTTLYLLRLLILKTRR